MSSAREVAFGLDPGAKPHGRGYRCHCPCHNDNIASLDVDEGDAGRVLVICRAGCAQADLLEAVRARGLTLSGQPGRRPKNRGQVVRWTPKGVPKPAVERLPRVRVVATYDYKDEHGIIIYQVVRWVPKTFRQRRPDGNGNWIDDIEGITPLPYRLPQLLASRNRTPRLRRGPRAAGTTPIYITEGEKDADRLTGYGLVATTNSGGAKKDQIWAQIAKWFKDRRCVLIPDNDKVGRDHVRTVGHALTGIASSLQVLELPGLPEKGDASDWFDAGGTIDEFRRLADAAPLWVPKDDPAAGEGAADDEDDQEIARLAALSRLAYGRTRKEDAKRLGITVTILDQEVDAKRAESRETVADDEDDGGNGLPIEFPEIESWEEEVDGAELLDDLAATIGKYVILDAAQKYAIALWVLFAHAFAAFEHNPKLLISSAEKRSGKTRLLDVLERLVPKPLGTSRINANALLRVIALFCPCMLIDEFDRLLKSGKETAEALTSLLNSGFTYGSKAREIKLVPNRDGGGGWDPRAFSTYCPQVIAGIATATMPDTLPDRSVQIVLVRKLRSETVKPLRSRDGGDLHILSRKVARWAADHLEELAEAYPAAPQALNDRAADAWRPLITIGGAAGGKWPELACTTALKLSGEEDTETRSVMVLTDARKIFMEWAEQEETDKDRISSDDLVDKLIKLKDRPWPEYKRDNRPLSQRNLADLLRPHRIRPKDVRFSGRGSVKGYTRDQFEDAWARYLDPHVADRELDEPAPEGMARVLSFGDKVRAAARRPRKSP